MSLELPKLVEGSLAANAVAQLLRAKGLQLPPQPGDLQPTLVGSPDQLDLQTADMLHIQACRWLEYVECQVASAESSLLLAKHKARWTLRRGQHSHGKVLDKWPLEVLNTLEAAETFQVHAEALAVALRGVLSSLQKVKTAASRSITRHTKSDVPSTNGGKKWNPTF